MAERSWSEARWSEPKLTSNFLVAHGPNPSNRYEVQFQKDCQHNSVTNNLDQAKHYARSLADWNLAAQSGGIDSAHAGVSNKPRATNAAKHGWIQNATKWFDRDEVPVA